MGEIRALFAAEVSTHFLSASILQLNFTQLMLGYWQLLLKSETRCYSQGSIIADSREEARGLMVITSGQVKICHLISFLRHWVGVLK
jgi:hypothetical protein